MGKVVAARATMHAPQLFTRPPEEYPKQLDVGLAAMGRLGEVLDETKPWLDVDPLCEHPAAALMAIHVRQAEQRRMLKGAA